MHVLARSAAGLLMAVGLAGCSTYGSSGYSRDYGLGYGGTSPYGYGSPFGYSSRPGWYGNPGWNDHDHWDDDDRDALSERQVIRGLGRQGYRDFGDIDKRNGFYFVEARDNKGRPYVLKINKFNGRIADKDRQ